MVCTIGCVDCCERGSGYYGVGGEVGCEIGEYVKWSHGFCHVCLLVWVVRDFVFTVACLL